MKTSFQLKCSIKINNKLKQKTNKNFKKERQLEVKFMARIAGVDLPRDKRVEIGLTYIYGVGRTTANKILKEAGVSPDTRVKDLKDEDVNKIRKALSDYKVEGELRSEISLNVKRLSEIGCYRGLRHRRNLPVRGQRTKTNARTRKGPKKVVSRSKKKVWEE